MPRGQCNYVVVYYDLLRRSSSSFSNIQQQYYRGRTRENDGPALFLSSTVAFFALYRMTILAQPRVALVEDSSYSLVLRT